MHFKYNHEKLNQNKLYPYISILKKPNIADFFGYMTDFIYLRSL